MKISPQDLERDFYAALGVEKSASAKEIKRAYRKLAQEYHPDKHPGDSTAEEKFKEISYAYDILGDAEKRSKYDEGRKLMAGGGFRFGPGGQSASGFGAGGYPGGIRLEDLGGFASFFDMGGGMGGNAQRGPRRGRDVEASLTLGFADALKGVTTTITTRTEAKCASCNGTGAEPGTLPVQCPRCHGSGSETETQGGFGFVRACTKCSGTGQIIENPCAGCGGSGVQIRPRNIKVRIPAGVEDGQTIRLKGKGAAGGSGGPAGDLYVKVRVAPNPIFGRKGADLTVTVPVTFTELALGANVKVPTMDEPVTIKIPAGTRSGRTFKVRGKGAPKKRGGQGDLLVKVEVVIPQKLKAREKALLEEFAELHDESPRVHLDEHMKD